MPPVVAAVIALAGLVAVFSVVCAGQLKSENAGMVDPVWTYSLGAAAVRFAVLGTGNPPGRALAAGDCGVTRGIPTPFESAP